MVFGLGGPSLKGCKAIVTLPKTEFKPGEAVHGRLALSVKDPVECLRFTVALVGRETLAWQETSSSDDSFPSEVGSVSSSNPTTHDYSETYELFRREISLLEPSQSVLPPGQHGYPFELLLHSAVAGTHETIPFNGRWQKIRSSISYVVEVKIHQKGAKKPTVLANRPFTVHALPLSPAKHPARPVNDVEETPISFLCCFNKGMCKLTVRSDKDTVDINHGVLPLVVSVANETSLSVKSLTVSIHQSLLVHVPSGQHKESFTALPQCVRSQVLTETIGPNTKKEEIRVPVSMARFGVGFRSGKAATSALVPSCELRFATVLYHIKVELVFDGWFLTDVLAVIPIKLLHMPEAALPVTAAPASSPATTAAVAPLPAAAPVDVTVQLTPTASDQSLKESCGEASPTAGEVVTTDSAPEASHTNTSSQEES